MRLLVHMTGSPVLVHCHIVVNPFVVDQTGMVARERSPIDWSGHQANGETGGFSITTTMEGSYQHMINNYGKDVQPDLVIGRQGLTTIS